MSEFMTPPKHVNFRAKKLFGAVGNIVDGAVAYIDLNGGRPTKLHTHEHHHVEIVSVRDVNVNPCISCNFCFKTDGICAQKSIGHINMKPIPEVPSVY